MRLSKIGIRNFRRLKNVVVSFEIDETVFVGPNNSGKTSATAAVRSFLGRREFKIHDFSACEINSLDSFGAGEEVETIPSIQLDLWFSVDPNHISFGQVISLSTGVSVDFTEIGIQCSLELKSRGDLLDDYRAAFPEQEDGNHGRSLSHFLGLEGKLKQHFHISYYSLESTVEDPTPLDPSEGKRVLQRFLRADFVDAQRNIDDENATRSNKLSEAFAAYYKDNLDQAETSEEAIVIIDKNNEELSKHYKKHFKNLMGTIRGLGVPQINDRELRVISALSPQDALKGNTELYYNDPDSEHALPEAYNGLGFKNLVFMAVQIDHHHRQWLATEENRPLCHVIFVEEPEVHLHVQVQQTFIRNMWSLLQDASPEGVNAPQLAITTHSSHILDTVDFSKVRYFRRCGGEEAPAGAIAKHDLTTIHSLRDFAPEEIDDEGNEVDPKVAIAFLQKYLKLTHCDLFFADAAILVEGTVEKLLLPKMIENAAPMLNSNYLTTLEVGGAYALRFAGLLGFLHIPYLVITDIDAVDPANNRKACRSDQPNAVTSNASLKNFFPDVAIAALDAVPNSDQIQSDGNRYVAFQKSEIAEWQGANRKFHGRTLEETFVYGNLLHFSNGTLSIGVELPAEYDELIEAVFKRIGSRSFKKTEFALDLLSTDDEWTTPTYISDGLIWLQNRLNPPVPNPEAAQ
ncbi:MAG: ATP-dependent endonuclease [Rhizobiaceae bacterium]